MGGEIRRVDQKTFELEARIYESNKNTREKMRKLMELKERVKGMVSPRSLISFLQTDFKIGSLQLPQFFFTFFQIKMTV